MNEARVFETECGCSCCGTWDALCQEKDEEIAALKERVAALQNAGTSAVSEIHRLTAEAFIRRPE